jgi:hypothetical protein
MIMPVRAYRASFLDLRETEVSDRREANWWPTEIPVHRDRLALRMSR